MFTLAKQTMSGSATMRKTKLNLYLTYPSKNQVVDHLERCKSWTASDDATIIVSLNTIRHALQHVWSDGGVVHIAGNLARPHA